MEDRNGTVTTGRNGFPGIARKWLWIALCVIFLLHLGVNCFIALEHREFFLHDDGSEYMELALSFSRTGEMISEKNRYYESPRSYPMPEAYRSLLLPFLGGCFIKALGNPWIALAVCQAAVMTALSLVLFRIGERIGSEAVGWLALLLINLHPLFAVYSMRFSSESLFTLSLAVFTLVFLGKESWGKYVLLGICGGLSVWVRPTTILLLPALVCGLLFLLYLRRKTVAGRERWISIARIGVFSLVFFLCVLPGGLRNLHHFGTFNLTSYLGGFNLYLGYNSDNLNAYKSHSGKEFLEHQNKAWERSIALVRNLPESCSGNPALQDRILKEKAFEEIRKMGIGNSLYLGFAKAWHFIRPWPLYGAHGLFQFAVVALWECGLFLCAGFGIWLLRRKTEFLLIAALVIGTGWAAHAGVHVLMRHRAPFLDPFLVLFTAYALAWILEKGVERWKRNRALQVMR